MFLNLKNSRDLELLALDMGWSTNVPKIKIDLLSGIKVYSGGNFNYILPPKEVITQEDILTRITEPVIICCDNFGLIYKDSIYPFGLSHSPVWLDQNVRLISKNQIHIRYKKSSVKDFGNQEVALLGVTNHWGHFFVDALDRLKSLSKPNIKILHSGQHFFGLNPSGPINGIAPQVSELITALGYSLAVDRSLPTIQGGFFVFNSIEFFNLQSLKPAISSATFLRSRDYLLNYYYRPIYSSINYSFVYLGRQGQNKRTIPNEIEVIDRVKHYGGNVLNLGGLDLNETIDIISNARNLMLVIGSAKFNLIFCKPGTNVICVAPAGYSSHEGGVINMIRHICFTLQLNLLIYEVPIAAPSDILLNSDLLLTKSDVDHIVNLFSFM